MAPSASASKQANLERALRKAQNRKPERLVNAVKRGQAVETEILTLDNVTREFRTKLVKTGIIDVLLDHLQGAAQSDDFRQYLAKKTDGVGNLGGPSVWIHILLCCCTKNALTDEALQGQMAEKISTGFQPLVGAVVDWSEGRRDLFDSKLFYLDTLFYFIDVLNYLGFILPTKTRDLFLSEHRKPLFKLMIKVVSMDGPFGAEIMAHNTAFAESGCVIPFSLGDLQNSAAVLMMGIVNEDSVGNVSNTWIIPLLHYAASLEVEENRTLFSALPTLMLQCRSETLAGVGFEALISIYQAISEEVEQSNHADASMTAITELVRILQDERVKTKCPDTVLTVILRCSFSDEVWAVAITSGLLDTLCEILVSHENDKETSTSVTLVCAAMGRYAFHPKTKSALRKRVPKLQPYLDSDSKRFAIIAAVISKAESISKRNNSIHEAIVVLDYEMCLNCCKVLSKTEEKHCSRCRRATYCCHECLANDWRQGGHKTECNQMKSQASLNSNGAIDDVLGYDNRTFKRLCRVGSAFLSQNISSVMKAASLQGINILDKIIALSFANLTPSIIFMDPYSNDEIPESCLPAKLYADRVRERERNVGGSSLIVIFLGHFGRGQEYTVRVCPPSAADELIESLQISGGEPKWDAVQKHFASELETEIGMSLDQICANAELHKRLSTTFSQPNSSVCACADCKLRFEDL